MKAIYSTSVNKKFMLQFCCSFVARLNIWKLSNYKQMRTMQQKIGKKLYKYNKYKEIGV